MSVMFCDNASFSIHSRDKNYNEFCRAENDFREVPPAVCNNGGYNFTLMNEQLTEGEASEFCTMTSYIGN